MISATKQCQIQYNGHFKSKKKRNKAAVVPLRILAHKYLKSPKIFKKFDIRNSHCAMNTSAGTSMNGNTQRKISNQNIQVYVRVRPINARERCIRSAEVVDVVSPREIVVRHSLDSKLTKKFTFDRTFGPDSRQHEVYGTVVAPLIEEVLSGYNCTVFAYGQTGTGKTHTMVGNECAELKSSWEDDSEIGIIPRALSHLFDELRLMELEFSMRISYLELYNEELCDLLSSDDSVKIRIFDDSAKKGSVIIQGLEEIPVHSKDDVYKLLEKGKERRKTATTLMNAQSSRSHTVFSILVHIRENGIDGEEMLKIGKLNLVDLAGSENVSKAGNEKGIRVRETVNINQSLLTLGRVITALVERTPHIPYRESKLTRLLQESLGGRTKTSIIATISPGHKDIEETLSTLEYAHRAKNIQNKPEVNQKLTKRTVLKEYTEEIDKLKRDLIAARDKNGIYLAEETYIEMTLKMDSQNRELNEKMLLLKALKDELLNKEKIFNEVSLNLVDKTEELKRTEKHLNHTTGALLKTKKTLNDTKKRYKEKKALLNSHVKTEEELTNQATQILQVADIATKDTYELHDTIERRKDVDVKIQTACERFSERMYDNFEFMDGNLDTLQEQHKSYSQMLVEEFENITNVPVKLLSEAKQKINKVNTICEEFIGTTSSLTKKYAKTINELSDEHKASLMQLFKELRIKELEFKTQIHSNLTDLQAYNSEQLLNIDTMRQSIAHILEKNTNNINAHTFEMKKQIEVVKQITESNMHEIAQMHVEIANEASLAAQQQTIVDEMLKKLQAIQEQRQACTNNMNIINNKLEDQHKKSIAQLQSHAECAQQYNVRCCSENATAHTELEQEINNAVKCADKCVAKCSTLQIQTENHYQENVKLIEAFDTAESAHNIETQKLMQEHESKVKEMCVEKENDMKNACIAIEECLNDDTHRLKGHIMVANEIATTLQGHVTDYANMYKEQILNCANDVTSFKESELQTYKSTGETPSKRNFIYPRVLASTSPHNQIVRRFRQENEWSDLDTTATIDEEGSDDNLDSPQKLSSSEVVLNSTPIETPEIAKKLSILNCNYNSSVNNTKQNYLRTSSSLVANKTPRKLSPRRSSPMQLKENKENIA